MNDNIYFGPSFICPRCRTTYLGEGMCPNCPIDVEIKATFEPKKHEDPNPHKVNRLEEDLQHHIDDAVWQLEELDYILALDLQFICAIRPVDGGMLTTLYNEILERANVWPAGAPVRLAWDIVLDHLSAIDHTRKAGI